MIKELYVCKFIKMIIFLISIYDIKEWTGERHNHQDVDL